MSTKSFVIDTHSHFIPEEAASMVYAAKKSEYSTSLSLRAKVYERAMNIERWVQNMDEAGVDMAVINMSGWGPMGLEVCKALNNGYARLLREYPKRFIACCALPLEGKAEVIDELNRSVNELGLKGISLPSSTPTVTLDSEVLFPIYEKASRLNMPIVVHPTLRHPLWGGEKYQMSFHVSREYDVAKATVEVMYGVLKEFPDLKFVMPHHGGGIPGLKGRLMSWFEPEGWEIPEALKAHPKTPRELRQIGLDKVFEELFNKIYFDTAGFGAWVPMTEFATKVISTSRLCFGTDYPFENHDPEDVKAFIDAIRKMDITEEDKRLILGGNIVRLFKI